jgi:peptidoglycan/LPS O-acetylase OafA/YrhL
MTAARTRAVVVAALACGAAVVALVVTSDHPDADTGWARLWPVVGWSFVATGLYAWRRRPDSRVGALMVLMGFAWFVPALGLADSPLLYTLGFAAGGLWGGVFLHLVLSFPSGRLAPGLDRGLATA